MQLRALTEARVSAPRVFTEKISGTQADRPGLVALMAAAREGDTLVLYFLDRLGRSLVHMVTTLEGLIRRGVALRSLTDTIDTTAGGRAVPAQRVRGDGRVSTGVDRGKGPRRAGGSPGPWGAAGTQVSESLPSGSGPSTGCTGRSCPTTRSTAGSECPRARWASVLRGEIKSLAHVRLELPKDEISVWDTEANHAMRPAPEGKEDRCPAS